MLAERALGLRENMTPKEKKENPMPTGRFSGECWTSAALARGPVLPQLDLLLASKREDLEPPSHLAEEG